MDMVKVRDLKPGDVIKRGEDWAAGVDEVELRGMTVKVTHWFGTEILAADRLVEIEPR
jgi:hypothetical protein